MPNDGPWTTGIPPVIFTLRTKTLHFPVCLRAFRVPQQWATLRRARQARRATTGTIVRREEDPWHNPFNESIWIIDPRGVAAHARPPIHLNDRCATGRLLPPEELRPGQIRVRRKEQRPVKGGEVAGSRSRDTRTEVVDTARALASAVGSPQLCSGTGVAAAA